MTTLQKAYKNMLKIQKVTTATAHNSFFFFFFFYFVWNQNWKQKTKVKKERTNEKRKKKKDLQSGTEVVCFVFFRIEFQCEFIVKLIALHISHCCVYSMVKVDNMLRWQKCTNI